MADWETFTSDKWDNPYRRHYVPCPGRKEGEVYRNQNRAGGECTIGDHHIYDSQGRCWQNLLCIGTGCFLGPAPLARMYRLDSGGDGAGLFNNMVNVPPCRHDPKTEFPDCVDTNTCCREGQLLDGSCGGFKPLTLEQMTDQECSRRAPVGADVSYNQYNCYGNDSPACLWDAKAKKCIPKPKSMDFDVCEFIHRTSSQNGSVDIEQCKHGSHGCKVSMFGYQQGCEKK